MRRSPRQPGELLGHFPARVVGMLGEARVAAEGEGCDPPAAAREIGADLHAPFRQLEKPARVRPVARHVAAHFVDEPRAEVRRERRHDTPGPLRPRSPGGRERQRAHARRILRSPAPVQPQHQRLRVRDVPVDAEQGDRVVGGAVAREIGNGHGSTGRSREREKPRRRVRAHSEPLEARRIGRGERWQCLSAPAPL